MNGLELRSATIAVAAGGRSAERPRSLKTGANVTESLRRQGYTVMETDPVSPSGLARVEKQADVVFLALPGKYGEDGKFQGYLELVNKPYTGSGVLASAIGMHKPTFKEFILAKGIPTLPFSVIRENSQKELDVDITRVLEERNGAFPLFIKPASEGSSLGTGIARSREQIEDLVQENRKAGYGDVLVEPFVPSRSFTIGLLEMDKQLVVLPVVEIKSENEFDDHQSKNTPGKATITCPADLPPDVYKTIQELALATHNAVGAHGPSRVDVLIGEDGVPYISEINTLPALRNTSTFPVMAAEYGISYDELIEHVLKTAYTKPEYTP